jgi:chromate transporter
VLFAEVRAVRFGPLSLDVPVAGSLDVLAFALAALAAVCVFWLRLGLIRTLGVTAAVGLVARLVLS